MPKEKNEELHRSIACAAGLSFLAVGYDATSYQKIADDAGTTRVNVQYVAGKKMNLLLDFMELTLDTIVNFAQEKLGYTSRDYKGMFVTAQIAFALAFHTESFHKIAMDVLRNRELTEEMLALDYSWAYKYQGLDIPSDDSLQQDDIIMTMGGFYELLFFHLRKGTSFDYRERLREVVAVVAKTRDESKEAIKEVADLPLIDEARLRTISREIERTLIADLST